MGTVHTTANTSSHSQTGMACFKLWLYWLMLGHSHQAVVTASCVVTFLFWEHLVLRYRGFFYPWCWNEIWPSYFTKEYLIHFGRGLWMCSPEGCHYFPVSIKKTLIKFEGGFVPSCKHFFLMQMLFFGDTLLLLELHRCISFSIQKFCLGGRSRILP